MIHGNRVFGNMGLESGVMVPSRRIPRACSKVKYQGKRWAGCKRSGRCATIYHGGKLRRGGVRQYVQGQGVSHIFVRMSQCCLAEQYVRNLFAKGRGQSSALAFVLSGSHAFKPMSHNLSWGLASARRRWHSVHDGQAHFLVLG